MVYIKYSIRLFTLVICFFTFSNLYSQPTSGLVAWYPFNGNAIDGSTNGNNGTVNGAALTTDRKGNANSAYYVSGISCQPHILATVNTTSINTSGEVTFAFWIYREGDGCSAPRVFQFGDGSKENDLSGGHFVLGWANGEKRIFIEHSSAGIRHRDYNWGSDLDDRTWYHIAYTFNGSIAKLYINGQLINTRSTTGSAKLEQQFSMGRFNKPAYDAFNGKLDDIGVWNRALSDAEILGLYKPGLEINNIESGNKKNTLLWTSTSDTAVKKYKIYRSTSAIPDNSLIAELATISDVNVNSFIDSSALTNGVNYFYRMKWVFAGSTGDSVGSFGNELTGTPNLVAIPINFSINKEGSAVRLNWDLVAESGVQYQVYRGTAPTSKTFLDTLRVNTYLDNSISSSTVYYYWIRTLSSNGAFSDFSEALTMSAVPYINQDSSRNGIILFKLNQISNTAVNRLNIYKGTSVSPSIKYDSTTLARSYTDSANIIFNTILYYRLTSNGTDLNESSYSNEIRTISFKPSTLLSPINLAVKSDTTCMFVWSKIPNALSYKLQYSEDSLFATNVIEQVVTDTSYTKAGLSENKNYYWRVQTQDTVHYSNWSNFNRFQTFLIPPIISAVKAGNRVDTISWSIKNTTNVKYFKIYRDTVTNPIKLLDSVGKDIRAYADASNLILNTKYYYRVVVGNNDNVESSYSNEIKSIVFGASTLLSPINLAVKSDTTCMFVWSKIPNALSYKLQYSEDSLFATNVIEQVVTDTSYTKAGLSENKNYYWRVQTQDTVHYSNWSNFNRFQTFLIPPIISAVKAGNRVDTISWSIKNTTNVKYFKIYRDTIANPQIVLDSIAGSLRTYIDTTKLQLNKKYYYSLITGNNENIESTYSNELSATPFNTLPRTIALTNKSFNNVGEFNYVRSNYSAVGSIDPDGKITDYKWYVNDSLVNAIDTILIYYFNQGSNIVKLVITDNDGGKDSSSAVVNLSSFTKTYEGGFLGGITALSPNIIYTADSTYSPLSGASISKFDRNGNTIYPLVVSSKIFTTPSVSSDSSVFITSGSSLNGFNKSGAPLWSTIPLGGLSYVTPTIDSFLTRIYLGISNKNFFAIDYITGKVAWNILSDAPIKSSAVITGDRKLVFISQLGTLYGYDIRTNNTQTAPKWKYLMGELVSKSPAVDGTNNLYIGTDAGNLVKLTLKDDSSVTKVWSIKLSGAIQTSAVIDGDGFVYIGDEVGDFYKINPTDGAIIWTYNSGAAIRSTPAISDFGSIYFANMNGLVTAIGSDKAIKWKYKETSPISANLLYISNMIYAGTESGKLFAVYDNPQTTSVNTSLSIVGTPSYIEQSQIKSMSASNSTSSVVTKIPVWGTFQGNYRRTGSRSFDCPDVPIVKAPACSTNGDSIRISTSNLTQKYWVVNDKTLDTKDTVLYIKPTDKYKIIAFNSIGCNVSSSTPELIVNSDVSKPIIITSTGTGKFCVNDSITLSSSVSATNYQWNVGGFPIANARNKSLTTYNAGNYSLTVINDYGCKSLSDVSLVTSIVKPTAPIITRDTAGNLLSSSTGGNQWYKAGVLITGATSKSFKPTEPSAYSVTTNTYGCESALSTSYYYLVTDIINLRANEFIKLAPNPFINQLNFDFAVKGYQRLNIEVFDLATGSKKASMQNLTPGLPINLSQLAGGTYIIKVSSNDGKINYQFKMIKL